MSENKELREGDIVRWRWKDGVERSGDPYWCKSRVAIFHDGSLYDTFWVSNRSKFSSGGGTGPGFKSASIIQEELVDFTVVGNINDMEEIRPGDEIYYDQDCIVIDMRHSNNSCAPVYIRRGSTRARNVMLELVDAEREKLLRKIKHLDEVRAKIEDGDIDVYI